MLPAGHPVTTSGSDVGGKGSLCPSVQSEVAVVGSSDARLTNRKSSESLNKRRRENTFGNSSVKQRQEKGRANTAWAEWFEQARHDQQQAVNPIYAQALQGSYDAENFVVDLGQEEREAIICDDGMLPAVHPVTTRWL